MATEPLVPTSWFEAMQLRFGSTPSALTEIIIFVPLGILIGFLSRILGRYLIVGIIAALVILWFGDRFNLLTLHMEEIKIFFGVEEASSIPDLWEAMVTWAEGHVPGCLSLAIGFVMGWQLGK